MVKKEFEFDEWTWGLIDACRRILVNKTGKMLNQEEVISILAYEYVLKESLSKAIAEVIE